MWLLILGIILIVVVGTFMSLGEPTRPSTVRQADERARRQ
jgi:hypothetical protein